jgi:hypothetical protein
MSDEEPILLPCWEDEVEAVQRAVIGVMHVLVDIAQDGQETTDDRLMAVDAVLQYAQEAHPYMPDEDEEEEESTDDTPAPPHRSQWPFSLRQGLGLRRPREDCDPEDD